jgi:hypothetical protein
MKKNKRKWSEDVGSIDFMQLIIGLLIVGIACVGTFQALNYGNEQLNYEMRYRRAISTARSYLEYWQGRVHVDFNPNDVQMRQGNLGQSVEPTLLDDRGTTTQSDDIYCYVRYGPITPVTNQALGTVKGQPVVSHWVIRVQVTWWEPDQTHDTLPHEVVFQGTMVPAAL